MVEVVGLVTTIASTFNRVAMHGVRTDLVRAQAKAARLPLAEVDLPWPCSNAMYESIFAGALADLRGAWGISHVAFGDLFLEDVRAYRERLLQPLALVPLFPLWQRPTAPLIDAMLAAGVRAHIACLDPTRLDRRLAGRVLDRELLASLGPDIDPCGERGEFHTFVAKGPMLDGVIPVTAGEVVERDGFVYADLRC